MYNVLSWRSRPNCVRCKTDKRLSGVRWEELHNSSRSSYKSRCCVRTRAQNISSAPDAWDESNKRLRRTNSLICHRCTSPSGTSSWTRRDESRAPDRSWQNSLHATEISTFSYSRSRGNAINLCVLTTHSYDSPLLCILGCRAALHYALRPVCLSVCHSVCPVRIFTFHTS